MYLIVFVVICIFANELMYAMRRGKQEGKNKHTVLVGLLIFHEYVHVVTCTLQLFIIMILLLSLLVSKISS